MRISGNSATFMVGAFLLTAASLAFAGPAMDIVKQLQANMGDILAEPCSQASNLRQATHADLVENRVYFPDGTHCTGATPQVLEQTGDIPVIGARGFFQFRPQRS
ncbi:MAG: hypothetical protein AAF569_05780 [Pseudomonadota bacterium]